MVLRPMAASRGSARAAFTLLEVLIVVAIIVVLAGAAGMSYMKFQETAYEDTAYAKIKALETVALAVRTRTGTLPQSLAEMTQPSADGGRPAVDDADAIKDPWGHEFQYDPNGQHNSGNRPDIWTVAPNGKTIGNWPGAR